MFIRHCPSRDLALSFRSKTINKWTAREVQEVFYWSSTERNGRIIMNKVEVSPNATLVSDIPAQTNAVSQDTSTLERLIGRGFEIN